MLSLTPKGTPYNGSARAPGRRSISAAAASSSCLGTVCSQTPSSPRAATASETRAAVLVGEPLPLACESRISAMEGPRLGPLGSSTLSIVDSSCADDEAAAFQSGYGAQWESGSPR